MENPVAENEPGLRIVNLGDVNGDGIDDLGRRSGGVPVVVYGGKSWGRLDPDWIMEGEEAGLVCPAGDMNGDGFDDVVFYLTTGGGAGEFVLFLGSTDGLSRSRSLRLLDGSPVGGEMRSTGDLDGDGFDDLVVAGRVFWGEAAAPGSMQTQVAYPAPLGSQPSNAGGAGDLDQDGFDDLLLSGAWRDEDGDGAADSWALLLYRGGRDRSFGRPWWIHLSQTDLGRVGSQGGDKWYTAIEGGMDFEGNGALDLVVGGARGVEIFSGDGEAGDTQATPRIELAQKYDEGIDAHDLGPQLGAAIGAGDVNGDGRDDLVLGAPGFNHQGLVDIGRIQVHLGDETGLLAAPDWVFSSYRDRGPSVGTSIAVLDLDGDGFDDIFVWGEARIDFDGRSRRSHLAEARLFAFHGQPDG